MRTAAVVACCIVALFLALLRAASGGQVLRVCDPHRRGCGAHPDGNV
jgi:hypothetical protein